MVSMLRSIISTPINTSVSLSYRNFMKHARASHSFTSKDSSEDDVVESQKLTPAPKPLGSGPERSEAFKKSISFAFRNGFGYADIYAPLTDEDCEKYFNIKPEKKKNIYEEKKVDSVDEESLIK